MEISKILTSIFLSYFLGYDRTVPGKPRYSVLGTDNSGEFSLQITDVQLEDDADYECQVGPALYNQPIRHKAHLTVQRKFKFFPLFDFTKFSEFFYKFRFTRILNKITDLYYLNICGVFYNSFNQISSHSDFTNFSNF